MEVKHYDINRIRYREVICDSYQILNILKDQYFNKGYPVWLNRYNCRKWILTIALGYKEMSKRPMEIAS